MINGIVQLPIRLPRGTVIRDEHGFSFFNPILDSEITVACGRNLRVPPANFYKVISSWGDATYEHIFAALDTERLILNYHTLTDQFGKVIELYPISMKRCGDQGVGTFIFVDNCNAFLQHPHINQGCQYHPVVSLPQFIEECLHACMQVLNYPWEDIRSPTEQILSRRLTPLVPAEAANMFTELMQYCGNPDGLYSYLDDIVMYESRQKFMPVDFIKPYQYPFTRKRITQVGTLEIPALDPITLLCLNTPTTLTSTRLLEFIGNHAQLDHYYQLSQITNSESLGMCEPLSDLAIFNSGVLDDLLTMFATIADTEVITQSDYGTSVLANQSHPTTRVQTRQLYGKLVMDEQYVREILQRSIPISNQLIGNLNWKHLTISKNWLDELYVVIELVSGELIRCYTNLVLHTLAGPSLINSNCAQLFTKLTWN